MEATNVYDLFTVYHAVDHIMSHPMVQAMSNPGYFFDWQPESAVVGGYVSDVSNPSGESMEWFEDWWNGKNKNNCAADPTKYPSYNPDFFNNYCNGYAMCLEDYTQTCEPNIAIGFTAWQLKWMKAASIGGPIMFLYQLIGLIMTPYFMCVYTLEGDTETCSFGLIKPGNMTENATMEEWGKDGKKE
jgi:hypothetical protein